MIKFSLKCREKHEFESWFASNAAFEKLQACGRICCPLCGSSEVEKAMMAPRLRPAGATAEAEERAENGVGIGMHALSAPSSPAEAALRELRRKIQEHSEYVGSDFADEARAIHAGLSPQRSIYGETDVAEAQRLIEEGVPVAPLPFTPTRKTN